MTFTNLVAACSAAAVIILCSLGFLCSPTDCVVALLIVLCRVLYAPLGFFLQNPVGEMLVAFTKDQDILDENLIDTLHYLGIYGGYLMC